MRGLVQRNYAGYRDRVARVGETALLASFDRAAQAPVADVKACDGVLAESLKIFQEGHMGLWVPPARRAPHAGATAHSSEPTAAVFADAVLITAPSFDVSEKVRLSALIAAHDLEIRGREALVIDVRGNAGGGDSTYAALLPYLYTAPIVTAGVDLLATLETVAGWKRVVNDLPPEQGKLKEQMSAIAAKLEAAPPGTFVSMGGTEPHVEKEVLLQPARVFLVIDETCASACEQLVLTAQQSRKVTLVGTHTAGVLDHANVLPFPLPSSDGRILTLASSRSHRLPEHPVDPDGIAAWVQIPADQLSSLQARALVSRVLQLLR